MQRLQRNLRVVALQRIRVVAPQQVWAAGGATANFTASLHHHYGCARLRGEDNRNSRAIRSAVYCRPGAERIDQFIDEDGAAFWGPVLHSRTVIEDEASPISLANANLYPHAPNSLRETRA